MNKEDFYEQIDRDLLTYPKVEFPDGIWVEFIDGFGSDYRIVQAARVSYRLDDRSKGFEKDYQLLKQLLENGHMSPFEHVVITLRLHVPIFIARQIMRHRTFSYSEQSRRYTKSNIEFWYPSEGRLFEVSEENANLYKSYFDEVYQLAYKKYQDLLAVGFPKEVARAVLPVSLFTKFYMTGNLRNWLHFLDLRLDKHAQYEAQEVASGVKTILEKLVPFTMKAWKESKTRGLW